MLEIFIKGTTSCLVRQAPVVLADDIQFPAATTASDIGKSIQMIFIFAQIALVVILTSFSAILIKIAIDFWTGK
jgi:hypothetical protein